MRRGPDAGPASKEQRFQEEAEALRQSTPADRLLKKAEKARRKAEARARAKTAHEGGRAVTLGRAHDGSCADANDVGGEGDDDGTWERSPSPVPLPRPVVDPACLGMRPLLGSAGAGLGDADGYVAERKPKTSRVTKKSDADSNRGPPREEGGDGGPKGLSLDEQEALVLRLLDRR